MVGYVVGVSFSIRARCLIVADHTHTSTALATGATASSRLMQRHLIVLSEGVYTPYLPRMGRSHPVDKTSTHQHSRTSTTIRSQRTTQDAQTNAIAPISMQQDRRLPKPPALRSQPDSHETHLKVPKAEQHNMNTRGVGTYCSVMECFVIHAFDLHAVLASPSKARCASSLRASDTRTSAGEPHGSDKSANPESAEANTT